MIEFKGLVYGDAAKRVKTKARIYMQIAYAISAILFLPLVIFLSFKMLSALLAIFYIALYIMIFAVSFIPMGKKDLPHKIVIDDEMIISISEKYTETRYIADVTVVKDWGDYYELVFPFGKVSNRFICQKCLLSEGSLQDFETLFDGKIVKQ